MGYGVWAEWNEEIVYERGWAWACVRWGRVVLRFVYRRACLRNTISITAMFAQPLSSVV